MKNTFSNIRTLAALLMAGAAFAACSSDDIITEQPANPSEQVYTLTINASKGDGTTRALDLDGTSLVASWANGDELTVYNQTKFEDLGGTLTASNASGNTATFSGVLTGTIEVGDELILNYQEHNYFTEFPNQDGTLKGTNGAEKYDLANAHVTVASVDEGNITIEEASASFITWTAMLKLKLQDGSSNLLNASSLTISVDGIGELLTFSSIAADANTANGDGILYFALPSAETVASANITTTEDLAAATVTFTAEVGSYTYTATKTGYKFAAGKYYAATLTMDALITSPVVGQVIGDDGKNYADAAAATAAGTTAVAIITYVGSDNGESAPYNHGLALALTDANGGSGCWWGPYGYDAGHTKQPDDKFEVESGLQYNSFDPDHNIDIYRAFEAAIENNGTAAPTGCSAWFLASGYQWAKMITAAAGGGGSLTTLIGLDSDFEYWASSEINDNEAWTFKNCIWVGSHKDSELVHVHVRSCLAF